MGPQGAANDVRAALAVIDALASDIGPRRPTSAAEGAAVEHVRGELVRLGARVELQEFRGISTFAWPQLVPFVLALAGRAGGGRARDRLAGVAAAALHVAEADPRRQPLTRLLARRASRNVVATLAAAGEERRTLCLVAHLDSSRSGALFAPRLAGRLRSLTTAASAALLVRSALLVTGRLPKLARVSAGPALACAVLLLERELRGHDVPGANDNASGVGAGLAVLARLAAEPLTQTRLVLLATGCEESGTVGMRAFRESRDTRGWLFVNLDGVAAPATLRYLPREGVGRTWPADPGLLRVIANVARRRPDLGLEPAESLVGLTYDVTQVLAAGGRALTISAQDATIPNYHTAGDTPANIDPGVLQRAIEAVLELARAVDRGEAGR